MIEIHTENHVIGIRNIIRKKTGFLYPQVIGVATLEKFYYPKKERFKLTYWDYKVPEYQDYEGELIGIYDNKEEGEREMNNLLKHIIIMEES